MDLLVIDDDETEKRLFEIYAADLHQIEVRCRFALDMEEARRELQHSRPDAIFLDNRIAPYENFTATVPLLRQAGFEGPVVVMSASLYDPVFDRAADHGVAACVDKLELSAATLESYILRLLPGNG